MELSKASDTLNHDLLIAKINECWFQHDVLKRIYSYLINRGYRIKVNTTVSSWKELIQGFP